MSEITPGYRFARVPEWLIYHDDVSALAVRVYAALDRHSGPQGAFPGLPTIAGLVNKSVDQVRRAVRELEAVGAVAVEPRHRDGRQTTNAYVLAGDAPMHTRPCTDARGGGGTGARDGGGMDARAEREQEEREQEGNRQTDEPEACMVASVPTSEVGRSVEFSQAVRILTAHAEDTCPTAIINRRRWLKGTADIIRREQADDIERLLNEGHTPQETAEQLTGDGLGVRNAMRKRSMEVHPPKGWEVAS